MPQTTFNFSAIQLKPDHKVQSKHNRMAKSMYIERRGQSAVTDVREQIYKSKTNMQ